MKKHGVIFAAALGGLVFTGCASSLPDVQTKSVPPSLDQKNLNQMENVAANSAQIPQSANTTQKLLNAGQVSPLKQVKSQLIKKATMSMVVESVGQTIETVTQLINKQQGDLIKLAENQPKDEFARHTALMQMRVPQSSLDATLDGLAKLGSVKSRNITAEDAGDRIVDFQAQLANLRRTEANLQKIMDKAGSVRDTLSVSQELSNVRNSIERIDAQLKNLQNQVTYSTITLNLEAAVSSKNPQRGFGLQVQETWGKSTSSVSKFSMGLVKLAIWLMVYSPYLFMIIAVIYGYKFWHRNRNRRGNVGD
ncbi:DUF4349 domain-containing protein [Brunnivagina elsteri]|uniref:DUF4349 domain-containing protein n=1 Tax=Brunnivagina elsteri CCALA 953 TaxID=987040 RepID=A0A2A2TGV3_9CYAN|nr:DUF4349 domain-containing protein [Calothrix elsteri]PAX53037.1 hypothetical protein CK510_16105 [Calothrix elsteri CCALA 953]